MTAQLRIGVLGASRIAEPAIIEASRVTGDVLVSVAARDVERARAYASEHGFLGISESYEALIADDSLDLIYIGLPNGLHAEWAAKALDAGRSVLVEKPFAANLDEFDRALSHLDGAAGWAWEAFHYADHPAIGRLIEIVQSGELGRIIAIDVHMKMPSPPASDPRWNFALAGGAMMDLGCYALNGLLLLGEHLAPDDRVVLQSARAVPYAGDARLDASVAATLTLGTIAASISVDMQSETWDFSLRVRASEGDAVLQNFVKPQEDDRLNVTSRGGMREEHTGTEPTYVHQLRRIRAELRGGVHSRPQIDRSRCTMALVDEVYLASGLPLRPGHLVS